MWVRHSTPLARKLENSGHFREGYFPKRSKKTPAGLFLDRKKAMLAILAGRFQGKHYKTVTVSLAAKLSSVASNLLSAEEKSELPACPLEPFDLKQITGEGQLPKSFRDSLFHCREQLNDRCRAAPSTVSNLPAKYRAWR